MTDVLSAESVTKRFGGLVAVNSIDFSIPEKGIVSLIGPNGAGKTTFFNVIAGFYDPTAGHISFRGDPVIARSRRTWLEPILWLVLPGIIAAITAVLALLNEPTGTIVLGLFITLTVLLTILVIGATRPPSYQRFLRRF